MESGGSFPHPGEYAICRDPATHGPEGDGKRKGENDNGSSGDDEAKSPKDADRCPGGPFKEGFNSLSHMWLN